MQIDIIGKSPFIPSEENEKYAIEKFLKLEKLLDDDISVRLVCKIYKGYHKLEATVNCKHRQFRAEAKAEDLYAAIDLTSDRIIRQVARHKDRINDKSQKEGLANLELKDIDLTQKEIVKKKKITLAPMTKEEAIIELEATDRDFYVFLDKASHKTNLVYLRDDGNYGFIETEEYNPEQED